MEFMKKFVRSFCFQLMWSLGVFALSVACGLTAKHFFAWSDWGYFFTGVYTITLGGLVFLAVLDKKHFIKNTRGLFTGFSLSFWIVVIGVLSGVCWLLVFFGLHPAEAVLHVVATVIWLCMLVLNLIFRLNVQ